MTSSAFTARRQRVSGLAPLVLLEMNAPSFVAPLQIVNDTRSWTSQGKVYAPSGFGMQMPNDKSGENPRTVIKIANAGEDLTSEIEGLQPGEKVRCTIIIVDREAPDVHELRIPMPLTKVHVDQSSVVATIGNEGLMTMAMVQMIHDEVTSPGIFQ